MLNFSVGVELCECRQEYTGNSCQDPAPGYCRRRNPYFLNSPNDLDLIGWAAPCQWSLHHLKINATVITRNFFSYNHSTTCDKETCHCTECLHHTTGPSCSECEVGYWGDATLGTETDCKYDKIQSNYDPISILFWNFFLYNKFARSLTV